MKYTLGLDIGIGSVGWAVVQNEGEHWIEDFGVRLFDSSENPKDKCNKNQERRAQRAARRVTRRRSHRKMRVKQHLQRMGLLTLDELSRYFEAPHPDPLSLRVKGLDEPLSPCELAACLIHISNHRGYQDYFETDTEDMTKAEKEEAEQELAGISRVNRLMEQGGYRTAAEMFLRDAAFACPTGGEQRAYLNHPYVTERCLVGRDLLRKEVQMLLQKQGETYPILLAPNPAVKKRAGKEPLGSPMTNAEILEEILLNQRDFEDGPGTAGDPMRKYKGFLDTLGNCRYYRDEPCAFRASPLADMYALVNVLSQYRYTNLETGELTLAPELARALLQKALEQGELKKNDVTKLAKKFDTGVNMPTAKESGKQETLGKCLKFLKPMKKLLDECGIDWLSAVGENYTAPDTLLNRISKIVCENHTPRRRLRALRAVPELNEAAIRKLAGQNFSGTAAVSEKYMKGAIAAFEGGELYGHFQSKLDNAPIMAKGGTHRLLPAFSPDAEFAKNAVVMRSLNETRKIINAVIQAYGAPYAINVEVASEVGNSFEERQNIDNRQKENEKNNQQITETVAALLGIEPTAVTGEMRLRYRLGERQGWHCLYSDKPIDKVTALNPRRQEFEVDHIVPFSLILDDTIHNKALVYTDENRRKGQTVPLMYLDAAGCDRLRVRANDMLKHKQISERTYRYLTLPNLENTELLSEWKSRNLNDTRYITKYLVRYLSETLQFAPGARSTPVFGVKGQLTSSLRRQWLNKQTWGKDEKDATRTETQLHHAVDAVVIAHITPATSMLMENKLRLNRIYYAAGKQKTPEYYQTMEKCINALEDHYHMPRRVSMEILCRKDGCTALHPALGLEVDVRFFDVDAARKEAELFAKQAKKDGEEVPPVPTRAELLERYYNQLRSFYHDEAFVARLSPPLVSYKTSTRCRGAVTSQNALLIKQTPEGAVEMKRRDVLSLKAKELDKLCTDDTDLRESLEAAFALPRKKEDDPLGEILKAQGKTEFVTQKGRTVRKVTLTGNEWRNPYYKETPESGKTALDTRNYWCVELYRSEKGELQMRGIMNADVKREGKKLVLQTPPPADYAAHVMYLFPYEYIVVTNGKGEEKYRGFYKSVFNINENRLCYIMGNAPFDGKKAMSIGKKDTVRKYAVSLLGRLGGEVTCGAPLLYKPAKK